MHQVTQLLDHPNDPLNIHIPGYSHICNARLIILFEGKGNYTIVHLKNNLKPLLVSHTLKRFESQLPGFIRASKSTLINPDCIEKVIQEGNKLTYLILVTGVRIVVSRRRLSNTLVRLERHNVVYA